MECPHCHNEMSEWDSFCPFCKRRRVNVFSDPDEISELIKTHMVKEPLHALESGSSIATTTMFNRVVNVFDEKPWKIVKREKLEEISDEVVDILCILGYIFEVENNKYKLTKKGKEAYQQNKKFQEKIKKLIESEEGKGDG